MNSNNLKKLIVFGLLLTGFELENLNCTAAKQKMPNKGEFTDYLVDGPANSILKPEVTKEFKLIILSQAKIFYSFLKKFNQNRKQLFSEKEMCEFGVFISQKSKSDYLKIVLSLKDFPQDQRAFLIQSYFAKATREALFDLIGAQVQDKENFILLLIAVERVNEKIFQEINDPNLWKAKK